jgi:hypothetical protein
LSAADAEAAPSRSAARAKALAIHVPKVPSDVGPRAEHIKLADRRSGYRSLFVYCREVLALSEHEAYNRIEVARAARQFPLILELLALGSVSLTAVRLLAPHLTPANHRVVLESARGKRKVEVEEIVARLAPRPDVASAVRRLPTPKPAPPISSFNQAPSVAAIPPSPPSPPSPATVVPLSPDRYKVQVTIGGDTLEKLRLAKDMLRHAIPSGDEATILDRALTALLADLARKKFGAADRPRPSRVTTPRSPRTRSRTNEHRGATARDAPDG